MFWFEKGDLVEFTQRSRKMDCEERTDSHGSKAPKRGRF